MNEIINKKDELKKEVRSRFQKNLNTLIWKAYLQRQRRWRVLLIETFFAVILFLAAIFIAKPVFLTTLKAEPEPPLTASDILASLPNNNILGYAPKRTPYEQIMNKAAKLLNISVIGAETEYELNDVLYSLTKKKRLLDIPVIWVIWNLKEGNTWRFSIRSTDRARYETRSEGADYPNPHLRAGFLAVQLAISQVIVETMSSTTPWYNVSLVSMPVSPLMQENKVRQALSNILLCFTFALIPPVLDTEALVVHETSCRFKRALRMRGVKYSSMYLAWLVYGYLTVLPICFLAAVTLTLIFRWIHLVFAMLLLTAYVSVMMMCALIQALFHSRPLIACVWTTLATLLQTYLAELLAHHQYDAKHAFTFILHVFIPPLGLVNEFNQFALLQTGSARDTGSQSIYVILASWSVIILLYFGILILLQYTIGKGRAIGGQVTWKSIIFKKASDTTKPRPIENPTGRERENLQEVDELVAKAVSFRKVSKSIMGVEVLKDITLDIYRGEFTMLFADRVQDTMIITMEDLLTGLTEADKGSINVLGHYFGTGINYMNTPYMIGYCHLSKLLIDELTVTEHLELFMEISLWQETKQYIQEYCHIREGHLLSQCDLHRVRDERVEKLDVYYRAQLCWAIATLLEPRIVIIPHFSDHPRYGAVIRDKIMKNKKYITIIKMCYASIQLEYGDRVFVFDNKILAFGGTPAYMFFKYGREYRVRMTLRSNSADDDTAALLAKATEAGATVRAHLGKLLILRLPTSPTDKVAHLVNDVIDNANTYGVSSMHITVADSEEVYNRAVNESKQGEQDTELDNEISKAALKRIGETVNWKREKTIIASSAHLRKFLSKFFSFYVYYRLFLVITILSAVVAGVFIGLSLTSMLMKSNRDLIRKELLHGEVLTIKSNNRRTILVLRADLSDIATSMANAYVLSEPNATERDMKKVYYTALAPTESLTEYLVTRAIDSPQLYVFEYAYGMIVTTINNKTLNIQALYSPLHFDRAAAARSLAKVYTTLLRHFTGAFDASIQVTDSPLALDLTPWLKYASQPPLLIQVLLILTTSHIILLPSKEDGLIRHVQSHAFNFSPVRYWFTLYMCNIIFYSIMIVLLTSAMVLIMYLMAPVGHFYYRDLYIIPAVLLLYFIVCTPLAYLFSLGPRVALNTVIFVIVNIIFGETTLIVKTFYGETLHYALFLMSLSPQYNMAYALVKIKQIFLYNSECFIYKSEHLCTDKILHKCCQKCGVLQECFKRRSYLTFDKGILTEVVAMCVTAIVFMVVLLLIEYKVLKRAFKWLVMKFAKAEPPSEEIVNEGAVREMNNVLDKYKQIKIKHNKKVDTFGEYLLAKKVTKKEMGIYALYNVYLGLGKGETVALSGLKRHGRITLCEILAGYKMPSSGQLLCMSKYRQSTEPHDYARHISLSYENNCLPPWMTVKDALELIALLRGVPKQYIKEEVRNYLEALELDSSSNTRVSLIPQSARTRLNFAAAVVGAPPVLIIDECTSYQTFSVRRAIYYILHNLKKQGHAILISSASVEGHLPIANRLAFLIDGLIVDIDTLDVLVQRYSRKGYTVVVHLKKEVVVEDVVQMFEHHFSIVVVNDAKDVLINIQVLDELTWGEIFMKMEQLKQQNEEEIYSYVITAVPIDYIYNSIINNELGQREAPDFIFRFTRSNLSQRILPKQESLKRLMPFEKTYDITKLKKLPWSVIFNR